MPPSTTPTGQTRVSRESLAKLGLLLAATAGALGVGLLVLHRFPNSGDEYSYLLQAEIFAKGRLSLDSAPSTIRAAFDVDHVLNDGRVRSKYFPGWPALMTLGALVRAPWLINPLLAGILAWGIYALVRRDHSPAAATFAAAFAVLNPFFLLNAGSYHTHVAELCWTVVAILGSRQLSPSRGALAVAALSFACFVATRPLQAVGLLAVVVVCTATRQSALAALAGVAGGAVVVAAYNNSQFGSPFTTGYAAYQLTFTRLYPAEGPAFALSNAEFIKDHFAQLTSFLRWCFPIWLLAPFGWSSLDATDRRWVAALTLMPIATLQLMPPFAGDSYGPRYLLAIVLPMAWVAGCGVAALQLKAGPIVRWGALAVLLGSIGVNGQAMMGFSRQIDRRMKPLRAVEAARLEHALVLLPPNLGPYGAHWLVRNGATLDGPVLFAASGPPGRDAEVLAWAAGREPYRLEVRGRNSNLRRIAGVPARLEAP